MKIGLIFFVMLLNFCQPNSIKLTKIETLETMQDSIYMPKHVSPNAKLINLGFEGKPVYVWVEFIGAYIDRANEYSHIYGIKHTYVDQKIIDTSYYETKNSRFGEDLEYKLEEYDIIPYPGDATYKLKNKNDSFLLFSVIQSISSKQIMNGKEWEMGIPTARINSKGEMVSGGEAHIHIQQGNDNIYSVSIIDEKGAKMLNFRLHGNCPIETRLSYLDKDKGRLYFVPKDCYLEINNKEELSKL